MTINELEKELTQLIRSELPRLYDFPSLFDVRLLKYSENITFKITFQEDVVKPVVFRVHRPGYHSPEEMISEMIWMEEIHRDTDVSLPEVYRGRDGRVLQQIAAPDGKKWFCSVVSFLEGKLIGNLDPSKLPEALEQVGEITAKLHLQSIHRDKSVRLERFSWDIHNFFDSDGVWGSWREYPGLNEEQREVLQKCQEEITNRLEQYGRSEEHYGMIHGDLHFNNIIQKDGVSQIFDFDDCGYGFYLYDLGCTLVTYSEDLDNLIASWVKGYERYRVLSKEDKELLPMFVLLRRIVRLAWLTSHNDSDTAAEVEPEYLPVTIEMGKKLLRESR